MADSFFIHKREEGSLGLREIKIAIADDSEPIRDLLCLVLSRVEGLNLIGMAADGVEAIRMIGALHPDVVVLDISMPRKNGIEVLSEIRKEDTSVVIIMFTADPSLVLREACVQAGANFFFAKSEIHEVARTCRQLLADGVGDSASACGRASFGASDAAPAFLS